MDQTPRNTHTSRKLYRLRLDRNSAADTYYSQKKYEYENDNISPLAVRTATSCFNSCHITQFVTLPHPTPPNLTLRTVPVISVYFLFSAVERIDF